MRRLTERNVASMSRSTSQAALHSCGGEAVAFSRHAAQQWPATACGALKKAARGESAISSDGVAVRGRHAEHAEHARRALPFLDHHDAHLGQHGEVSLAGRPDRFAQISGLLPAVANWLLLSNCPKLPRRFCDPADCGPWCFSILRDCARLRARRESVE